MAAGRKEYELQLKLSAAIGSNFNSSFQAAMTTTKKLHATLQSLKSVQGNISAYKKTQEAINTTKTKLQEYEAKHNTLQTELAQTAAKEKELQKALKQSESTAGKESEEYKQLQKELQNTRTEKSRLNNQIKSNERAAASANEKIKEQEQKLSSLSEQLKAAGTNTNALAQENAKLEKAYQRVQKVQEDYARVNSAIEKNKEAISETKTELVKTVGAVGAAGAAFYKGFITPAANLQEQMSTVKAISGATDDEMGQLNALAKQMGATTKFTATEAGQALEYMGMAGWKTDQMISGLPGIMNLAAASGEELATVSDIVTDAMTAFGLAADGTTNGISNVNYFTDILAATAANSNTNVELLGESFKFAAPLAGAFGFSAEDTALALGLMANSGIKASQSGTSLRKIFSTLTGELKIAQKDGSNFVVATQNADGSMRDLKSIIDDVRTAFNGMSDSDIIAMQSDLASTAQSLGIELNDENGELKTQAALYADVQDAIAGMTDAGKIQEAEAIAEKTAMAGLLSIVNASSTDYTKLADAIYNANGAAEKMAKTRLDNLNGDITLAKSAWDGLATTIGDMFIPSLRTAVQKVTEFLNKANEFAQKNPELIKQLAGVAAGLAGLKIGSLAGKLGFLEMNGGILETVKSFIGLRANIAENTAAAVTGGGKFSAFGKSITEYFGKVKSSVGGIGTSLNKLSNGTLGKISTAFTGLGGKISAVASGPLKTLGSIFGGLFGKVMPVVGIVSALSMVLLKLTGNDITTFTEPFTQAFEALKPVLNTAMESFRELGSKLLPIITDAAAELAPLLGNIVTSILPIIITLIEEFVPIITKLAEELLPFLLNIITEIMPVLSNIITAILPVVTSILQALMPIITKIVESVLPVIFDLIEALLPPLMTLVQAVLPVITTLISALAPILEVIFTILSPILDIVVALIQPIVKIFEVLTPVFEILGTIISVCLKPIMPLIQALADIFNAVLAPVLNVISGLFDGISTAISTVIGWISSAVGAVSDFFGGVGSFFSGLFGGGKAEVNVSADEVPQYANGGIVNKPTLAMVGEGGEPEAIIPLSKFNKILGGIPKFEKGSDYTPDTFIAGDVNGKGGELITGARGRKVFTAAQTTTILDSINNAKAVNDAAGRLEIKEAADPGTFGTSATGGETKFEINYNPTIYVDGDKPGDLEEKLKQNNEKLLQAFKEFLRQERENERRMSFA